jgi:hypothetical protein
MRDGHELESCQKCDKPTPAGALFCWDWSDKDALRMCAACCEAPLRCKAVCKCCGSQVELSELEEDMCPCCFSMPVGQGNEAREAYEFRRGE